MLAYAFGASYQYDAYVAAIMIPFILRSIFAEGAFSSAFVPIYARLKEKNAFATKALSFIFLTAVPTSILLMIFAPQVIYLFATGLSRDPTTFHAAILMERIVSFYVLLISLWSWGAGILNSHGSFFVPSLSPVFNNAGIIAGIIASPLFNPPILGVAAGFVAGGFVQFVFEIPYIRRVGFRITPSYETEPRNDFIRAFFFTSLAVGLGQINFFVDTNVASRLATGSISVLQYANRIYQLPMGILIVSLAMVYLPKMARKENKTALRVSIHESASRAWFVAIPSSVFIALFSARIVRVLFAHGAFSVTDAKITSAVLILYVAGFAFQSLFVVISRAFYAFKNAKSVMAVTALGVATNVAGDLILGFRYGPAGLAASSSLASVVSFLFVYFIARREYGVRFSRGWIESAKTGIASGFAAMASVAVLTVHSDIFALLAGTFLFFGTFAGISYLFKSENFLSIARILNYKSKE